MRLLLLPIALALSACSLTPALRKPEPPVPSAYPVELAQPDPRHAADIGWHAMFSDPRLRQLIELALRNNRDLRLATLNVDAVQAEY
ncbi:RND transporter, partial [Acinetobacter baumannii]|nr:RND transporter [Acinetobacter baumannii]